jgi:hypothetical protein
MAPPKSARPAPNQAQSRHWGKVGLSGNLNPTPTQPQTSKNTPKKHTETINKNLNTIPVVPTPNTHIPATAKAPPPPITPTPTRPPPEPPPLASIFTKRPPPEPPPSRARKARPRRKPKIQPGAGTRTITQFYRPNPTPHPTPHYPEHQAYKPQQQDAVFVEIPDSFLEALCYRAPRSGQDSVSTTSSTWRRRLNPDTTPTCAPRQLSDPPRR